MLDGAYYECLYWYDSNRLSILMFWQYTESNAAGMAIAGAGAGVNELTALAATAEMAPTRQRGKYVAILIFTIAPFAPSVLWAQLIADASSWRHVGAFCGAWSALGVLITAFFYFPPPRVNSEGLSRAEIISRVDFVGGFLSIVGLILFMAGMQWGGYQVYFPIYSSAAFDDRLNVNEQS